MMETVCTKKFHFLEQLLGNTVLGPKDNSVYQLVLSVTDLLNTLHLRWFPEYCQE